MVTVRVTGQAKTGKSIIAQEIGYKLKSLGAIVTLEDSSPNNRYRVGYVSVPLKGVSVKILTETQNKRG